MVKEAVGGQEVLGALTGRPAISVVNARQKRDVPTDFVGCDGAENGFELITEIFNSMTQSVEVSVRKNHNQ